MPANTPEDCDRLFAQYLNAGDLEALAALYEPQATLVQRSGEERAGRGAIREAVAGFMPMKPQIQCNVIKIVRAGTDLAVLYNDWNGTLTDPSGNKITVSGKALEFVRRQADGTWRFVVDDPYARG